MDRFIAPREVMKHRFQINPRPVWDLAIICFRDYKGSQILVKRFDAAPIGYKVLYGIEEFAGVPVVYEAEVSGKRVGIVTRCNWGAPQAAILVEELAEIGVKYIIGYGAAGSINKDLAHGTQLVVDSALCTDGTSTAYGVGSAISGSNKLKSTALLAAERTGCPLVEVTAATVDALYRETVELVEQWQKEGADVINMESGAFYAAAKVCGVEALWLGFVSDRLVKEAWEDWHVDLGKLAEGTASICYEVANCLLRELSAE